MYKSCSCKGGCKSKSAAQIITVHDVKKIYEKSLPEELREEMVTERQRRFALVEKEISSIIEEICYVAGQGKDNHIIGEVSSVAADFLWRQGFNVSCESEDDDNCYNVQICGWA